MTSPRTPRQPRERGCFHTAPCSCPNRYLVEVLPETPEPPQVINAVTRAQVGRALGNGEEIEVPGLGIVALDEEPPPGCCGACDGKGHVQGEACSDCLGSGHAHDPDDPCPAPEPPREDEDLFPSALAEHCYFEGCQEWITGSSDYCPTHAKLYTPVPASQSVPAVPVSSTGGKETGEAAETATEALGDADREEQPDGIADDSYDLPDPTRAAERVNAFLAFYGDGLIEGQEAGDGGQCPPLYARDLQALANLTDRASEERAIPEPTEGQNP